MESSDSHIIGELNKFYPKLAAILTEQVVADLLIIPKPES